MKQTILSPLKSVVLVSIGVLMGSCARMPAEQHTSFETLTLARETVTAPVSWSASMRGTGDVSIVAKRSGTIQEICVKDGQRVHKGDVLFVFDKDRVMNRLAQAKADLQTALSNRENARLEAESNNDLYAKGIISDYLLRKSQNLLQSAEAQVAQAEAAVKEAELNVNDCILKSPVDGLVGDIGPHVGDRVEMGTMLTRIAGVSEMEATFSLTESQVHALVQELGSLDKVLEVAPEMTLRLKEGGEYSEKGRITSFSGMVNQQTGSVSCYVTFPNPRGELFSGMQGTVVMPLEWENVILVPLTAIVRIQDKTMIYKVGADSLAHSAIVTIEDLGDGLHGVVLSGADVGEQIVAKGAANVHDNDRVIW